MHRFRNRIWALILFVVFGCAPKEEDESSAVSAYSLGGTVSGLSSGTVVLQNNATNDLVINQVGSGNVSFTFPTKISSGGFYSVSVKIHPNTQACTVNNGTGSVSADVKGVKVVCSSESHIVGGTVSGLTGTLVLQNNSRDDLILTQNGSFTFGKKIAKGADYNVSVKTQPSSHYCSVTSNRGLVTTAVSGVSVTCSTQTFLLSGTAGGLGSTTLTLWHGFEMESIKDNGSDNKSFSLDTAIAYGGGYNIAIPTQPDNRTCNVVNGFRESVTRQHTDLRAVCWTYIDNMTFGGINNNTSRDATTPTVSTFNSKLYSAWVENNVIRARRNDNGTSWTQTDSNSATGGSGVISSYGAKASEPFLVLESSLSVLYLLWVDQVGGADSVWFAWNFPSSSDSSLISNWFLGSSLSTANASSPYGLTSGGKLYVTWSEKNTVGQIRVRDIKEVGTVNSWLDGGSGMGINDNTSHHATNPVLVYDNSSVFYAAWSEENSVTSDNVSQIRVKKLDRSDNATNTNWVSIDGDNRTKGINYNSLYAADKPHLAYVNTKLYAAWQESSPDNKTQIRVAVYYDNLTITDNGPQLIFNNLTSSEQIPLSRSNCMTLSSENSSMIQDKTSSCWIYVDSGDNQTGVNKIVDADGNENATDPQLHVYGSQIYLAWVQEKSAAKQTRIALYNGNDSSPSWQTVDRHDEYGASRFGLNYNVVKDASNPVLASSGTKLYAVWAETDNSSGKSQIRVTENPM